MLSSSFVTKMTTRYTLIAADGPVSLESHFYCVEIGSTRRAHRALFTLSGYCASKGHYFQKRTRGDDIFRLKIAESLGCKVYELPSMTVKAETMVSYLKCHGALPWQPDSCHNLHQLKQKSSPTYYLHCHTKCLKRETI